MKHKFLSLLMAAFVVAAPLFAQGQDDKDNEAAEPATGVRFVNCSPAGISIPSPLYCRSGKTSRELRISSRLPSSRVKPTGTTIELFDKDPGAAPAKTVGAIAQKDAIKPVITLEVPSNMTTGKVLCILVPTDKENPFKVKPMFVKESSFPKNGVHIINFTATPMEVKISASGEFETDKVISKIGAYKGGVGSENTWSSPSGADGQQFSFILSAVVKGSKTPRRIKASRFSLSAQQSQVNLIVKDPAKDSYKLLSIQLSD